MTILYVDNTNTVTLDGLQNSITAAYINDATVTLTIEDSDGVEVTGETWPLTMSYVATSDGNYRVAIDAVLEDSEKYSAIINVSSSGSTAKWTVPITAIVRC